MNIVIAGGGPIGLYLAINLAERFKNNVKVTVADSALNDYNRPRVIAKNVIDLINDNLKKFSKGIDVPDAGCTPSNAIFISDLQNSLCKLAKGFKVELVEQNLINITDSKLVLEDNQSLPCDLLIDCTGERRAVIAMSKQFTIESIADNPIKEHFVAYVTMDKTNAGLAQIPDKIPSVSHALALEHLRTKFEWKEFSIPELVSGRWEDRKDNQVLFYYYFEISQKLARSSKAEQYEWLKALLKLKTGNDIEFTIDEENDLKFIAFNVDPKKVSNPICQDYFTFPIVACGDALMSADYRLGTGVRNGVLCANALIDSINIQAKKIAVDSEKYKFGLGYPMRQHESDVRKLYQDKKNQLIGTALLATSQIYRDGYSQAESFADKKIIRKGLFNLVERFNMLADGSLRNEKIQAAEDYYRNSLNIFAVFKPEDLSEDEKVKFFDLAASFKTLAGKYFSQKEDEKAENCYRFSLNIYQNHHKDSQWDEISKIYSNLAKIAYRKQDYNTAIELAERGLSISNEYNTSMKEKIPGTINDIRSEQCKNLLEIAKNKLNDQKDVSEELKRADELIKQIDPKHNSYTNLEDTLNWLTRHSNSTQLQIKQ